jgi:hypothetical protein
MERCELDVTHDRDQSQAFMNTVMNRRGSVKEEFLDWLSNC